MVQACLQKADDLKAEGNDHFRSKGWNEALAAYQAGLSQLPSGMKDEGPSNRDEDPSDEDEKVLTTPDKPDQNASQSEDCAIRRAVLNANIGACYIKLVAIGVLVPSLANDICS